MLSALPIPWAFPSSLPTTTPWLGASGLSGHKNMLPPHHPQQTKVLGPLTQGQPQISECLEMQNACRPPSPQGGTPLGTFYTDSKRSGGPRWGLGRPSTHLSHCPTALLVPLDHLPNSTLQPNSADALYSLANCH